jgi:hypothetical protein
MSDRALDACQDALALCAVGIFLFSIFTLCAILAS